MAVRVVVQVENEEHVDSVAEIDEEVMHLVGVVRLPQTPSSTHEGPKKCTAKNALFLWIRSARSFKGKKTRYGAPECLK